MFVAAARAARWARAMIHRRIAATLALALVFVASRPVISAEPKAPAQAVEQHRRILETSLLPLIVDTVTMPPAVDIRPGVGGGIAVVNGTVIIVDPQGAFVAVSDRGKVFRRLPLPALPNHAEEYVDFARKPVQAGPFLVNTGFRVHDVEVRAGEGGVRLFVSYERYLSEVRTTALAVSAISLDKNLQPLGSWQDVYESQPLDSEWYSGIAGGGRMLVRGDGLYLTVGDYNQDNVFMASRLEAQNPDSDFGKIVKIDLRTNAKSHVSIGHRNPQGLTLTANGTMYATEHGPQGGDELNRIVQGKNYGWPIETYGAHYGKYDWPAQAKSAQPFEKPVLAWVPSIGVSNLIEVENFHAAWNGDLLVESLKAQSLFRLRRDGNGRVVYSEPIPLGQRLRDIAALPDGTLVLWTDSAQLIFLSVDHARLAANQRPPL
jgi:glucose/arabinose dehydrogenase